MRPESQEARRVADLRWFLGTLPRPRAAFTGGIGRGTGTPMRRWIARPVAALLALLASGAGVQAQDLVPWRQGVVRPKADAGFWWMAVEGGFARQQGLDLKM